MHMILYARAAVLFSRIKVGSKGGERQNFGVHRGFCPRFGGGIWRHNPVLFYYHKK